MDEEEVAAVVCARLVFAGGTSRCVQGWFLLVTRDLTVANSHCPRSIAAEGETLHKL